MAPGSEALTLTAARQKGCTGLKAQLAVSHYVCAPDVGFEGFAGVVAELGYAGVGLTERAFGECSCEALRRVLRRNALFASSVNSAGYFLHADGADQERQARRNTWLLDRASDIEAHAVNVIVGGLEPSRARPADARRRAREQLFAFSRLAEARGVRLVVEPVHPVGLWSKGCFNTLAQVLSLLRDLPGIGLNIDLFHSWWDPDLDAALADPHVPLDLLQICGIDHVSPNGNPRRVPLHEDGVGVWKWIQLASRRVPAPVVELELFAAQLPSINMRELLHRSSRYVSESPA